MAYKSILSRKREEYSWNIGILKKERIMLQALLYNNNNQRLSQVNQQLKLLSRILGNVDQLCLEDQLLMIDRGIQRSKRVDCSVIVEEEESRETTNHAVLKKIMTCYLLLGRLLDATQKSAVYALQVLHIGHHISTNLVYLGILAKIWCHARRALTDVVQSYGITFKFLREQPMSQPSRKTLSSLPSELPVTHLERFYKYGLSEINHELPGEEAAASIPVIDTTQTEDIGEVVVLPSHSITDVVTAKIQEVNATSRKRRKSERFLYSLHTKQDLLSWREQFKSACVVEAVHPRYVFCPADLLGLCSAIDRCIQVMADDDDDASSRPRVISLLRKSIAALKRKMKEEKVNGAINDRRYLPCRAEETDAAADVATRKQQNQQKFKRLSRILSEAEETRAGERLAAANKHLSEEKAQNKAVLKCAISKLKRFFRTRVEYHNKHHHHQSSIPQASAAIAGVNKRSDTPNIKQHLLIKDNIYRAKKRSNRLRRAAGDTKTPKTPGNKFSHQQEVDWSRRATKNTKRTKQKRSSKLCQDGSNKNKQTNKKGNERKIQYNARTKRNQDVHNRIKH